MLMPITNPNYTELVAEFYTLEVSRANELILVVGTDESGGEVWQGFRVGDMTKRGEVLGFTHSNTVLVKSLLESQTVSAEWGASGLV